MKKLFVIFLLLISAAVCFSQQKFALVIGNGNYTGISRLTNPVNDANDIETALRSLGFTVEKVLNGNLEQMENAVLNLKRRLSGSRETYGFFFYAGHGVQASGENYLIPVAADNIRNETHLRERAVSLQFILDNLRESGNELNMVVLDACRDNPFGWARSGSRGLTVVSRAPSGTIVMYAAGAGQTASDGTGSRNGLFTGYLLNNLRTQGLSVYEIFANTMGNVSGATNGDQDPELSLRYANAHSVYLGARPAPPASPAPQSASASQPAPSPQPASAATIQPATTPTPQPTLAPQTTTTAAVHPITPSVTGQIIPSTGAVPPGFVHINGGTFTMGSSANEALRDADRESQRQVTVSSFNMGRYEVTQKEYQEVMGNNPSNFKGDNLPVENVSWFDAVEYCNRRSQREGLTPPYIISGSGISRTVTWNRSANGYRLPTEAEWEYACRAGTTTPFSTGNNITTAQANYNGNNPYNNNAKGEYRGRTTPVGTFAANAWGLYDMHGNVWEWCWDWYGDYASGAQTDPAGALSGSYRVYRGGSWGSNGQYLRSAVRNNSILPSSRLSGLGFRLLRP